MQHGEGREQHAHSGRDAKGVRVRSLYAAADALFYLTAMDRAADAPLLLRLVADVVSWILRPRAKVLCRAA